MPSAVALLFFFFFTPDFFYIAILCISDLRAMHPWQVGQFCMFVYKCCGTFSPPNIDTIRRIDEFIHVFFLHFHKCRPIFFVSMDNIILCDFFHKTWRGTKYFVLWDWNNRCPNVNEWIYPQYMLQCARTGPALGWCRVVISSLRMLTTSARFWFWPYNFGIRISQKNISVNSKHIQLYNNVSEFVAAW